MIRRGEGRAAGRLGPSSEVSARGVSPARPCSAACGTASHRCCTAPPRGAQCRRGHARVAAPRRTARAAVAGDPGVRRHRRAPFSAQAPRGVALPPLWAWQALATVCAPFLRPSAAAAAFLAPGSLALEAVRLPVSSPPELESSLTRPGQRSSSSLSSSSSSDEEGGSGAGAGRPRLVAGSAALRLGGELPGDASSQLSSLRRPGGPSEPDIPITCVAAAPPRRGEGWPAQPRVHVPQRRRDHWSRHPHTWPLRNRRVSCWHGGECARASPARQAGWALSGPALPLHKTRRRHRCSRCSRPSLLWTPSAAQRRSCGCCRHARRRCLNQARPAAQTRRGTPWCATPAAVPCDARAPRC